MPLTAHSVQLWADRFLQPSFLRALAVAMIATSLLLLVVGLATAQRGVTRFGPPVGADYAGFYNAAWILNHDGPGSLYDLKLQNRLYHELLPGVPANESLPYAHAPWLAALLQPLARLPFTSSYVSWLVLAAGLTTLMLGLVRATTRSLTSAEWTTCALLAISFQPFLQECWIGGQMSILGGCCAAWLLYCWRHDRDFGAGLAVALLAYKPTVVLWAVPMLLVMGSIRAWLGFIAGAGMLAVFLGGTVGYSVAGDYLSLLAGYAETTSAGSPGFKVHKHMDLNSFVHLLLGGASPWAKAALGLGVLIVAPVLVRCWLRGRRERGDARLLAACATFTFGALFNLYTPVYDLTLLVPGILITTDILARSEGLRWTPAWRAVLVLAYVTPWFTQLLAKSIGFQPMTLVLAAIGMMQLRAALRLSAIRPPANPSP